MNRRGALRWLYCLVVLSGIAPSPLAAEQPEAFSEAVFFSELPVVLTASRLGQSASDAPNAITIIDRELIRASGAREIAELLRLVPGVHVTYQTYAKGLQAIVSYHGLGVELGGRLQVLVDGRSVYDPTLPHVSWTDLPLAIEDIERIEIVRGPSAASHGANAFLGVINIITRHPAQDRGGFGRLTMGSRSVNDRVVRYAGGGGDVHYRLTAAYRADDMYEAVRDGRQVELLTFRADGRLGQRDKISIQAGYNGGVRETQAPTALQPSLLDPPRDIRVRNHFQQLAWVRVLDPGDELSLLLYHNRLETRDVYDTLPIPQLGGLRFPIDDSIRGHRYEAELQHTLALSHAVRGVWGGSLRRDVAEAPMTLQGRIANDLRRGFAHVEWRAAPTWLVNAGAMLENTSFTGTQFSPRASLNHELAPGHTVRAGISRAYRNPSILEERANRRVVFPGPVVVQMHLASGNLSPERIVSHDLGYVAELPASGLSFDARVFRDRITGLISDISVPFPQGFGGTTRDFRNLFDARQAGFETQWRWQIDRTTRAGFAQSYIDIKSESARIAASAPRNSYAAFLMRQFGGGLSGTLLAFHHDPVELLGFSDPQERVTRFDVRLAKSWRVERSRAEASLVVQDLLNRGYTDYRRDNVFGRRAYLSLTLEL